MPDVVITEFMDQAAVDSLAERFDVIYDPSLVDDRARLEELVGATRALIVRNRTRVDAALIEKAGALAIVGRLGVGLDNIDLDACADRGIPVRPATGANADAVAEYVIAAVLLLTRGVFAATGRVVAGEWPRTDLAGHEVAERTIGLVGFGDIARRVAGRARALGMDVVAHDPYLDEGHKAWNVASSVDFEELLAVSDAVSIHVPLTDDTRHLFDAETIAGMKRGAVLVNTSRGGIVDEDALVEALRRGNLAGAALDVFATEPVTAEAGARFADVPGLILTPHVAGVTEESNRRVSRMIADAVAAALSQDPLS